MVRVELNTGHFDLDTGGKIGFTRLSSQMHARSCSHSPMLRQSYATASALCTRRNWMLQFQLLILGMVVTWTGKSLMFCLAKMDANGDKWGMLVWKCLELFSGHSIHSAEMCAQLRAICFRSSRVVRYQTL